MVDIIYPVLKHGPRSITCRQEYEFFKLLFIMKVTKLIIKSCLLASLKASIVNFYLDVICSLYVVTRKMVNYTCVE